MRQQPIDDAVWIAYTLKSDQPVEVRICDLLGYTVRTFSLSQGGNGGRAGENLVAWDLADRGGARVERGAYIVIVEPAADDRMRTRMLVTR